MRKLLIGLLGALVATSRLTAATDLVAGATNPPPVTVPEPNDPVEKEYKKLLEDDDAAQAEVDQWIRDNEAAAAKGGGVPNADLKRRIRDRFAPDPQGLRGFPQAPSRPCPRPRRLWQFPERPPGRGRRAGAVGEGAGAESQRPRRLQ